jgi:hypothetical protein
MRVLQTLALPLGHDAIYIARIADGSLSNLQSSMFERAMRFELTTFSLARRRSTTELRPQSLAFSCSAESAETQDRTGDTAIFSRVLYQLSYLGKTTLLLSAVILHALMWIVKKHNESNTTLPATLFCFLTFSARFDIMLGCCPNGRLKSFHHPVKIESGEKNGIFFAPKELRANPR